MSSSQVFAHRRIAAALLATSALAYAMPAAAQDEPEAPEEYGTEIIVTANLRSESLQDVPISIQALGGETLAEQNVASFDDYAKLLPSVSYQSFGPGQAQLAFRGITSGGDTLDAGSLPATGLYLDEIPVTTIGFAVDLHVYDVARVEALSGPQGTLFGASSLSGTMRIITNAPDTSGFDAGFDVQLNKYGEGDMGGQVEGFANFPLSDNAALRVVGYYTKEGGYIDSVYGERTFTLDDAASDPGDLTNLTIDNAEFVEEDYNDVETYGGRAALKIDLDENWTATPMVMYQHLESHGAFLYDPRVGDLQVEAFTPEYNFDEWWQAALTIQGKIGNWDLVYAGGYFKRDIENEVDYSYYAVAYDTYGYYATYFPDGSGGFLDPTQRQYLNYDYSKLSQELRFSSPADAPLRATLGAFYQRQTNDIDAQYIIPGISGADLGAIVWFQPIIDDTVYLKRLARKDNDYAVFGQFEYDLTDSLTVIAGIRGFKIHNTLLGFSGFSYNIDADCVSGPRTDIPCYNVYENGATTAVPKTIKETGETHKLGLTYDIDADRMIYATYSTGYRPGGINRKIAYGEYLSDTLSNFEAGWKTSWLNGALRWNGAIFYQKWDDMQFSLARPGDNGVTSIANVGGAESKGIEMDVLYSSGGLDLSAAATYLDANITEDFCEDDGAGGLICTDAGTRLPVQPKFKVNASARYTFPIADNDAFVQASMLHQSGARPFLLNEEAAAVGYTSGFTTFDFSAGIQLDAFAVEAFIQNAFDKRGELSRNTACAPSYCGGSYRIYPVKPQFFGIKLSWRYDE